MSAMRTLAVAAAIAVLGTSGCGTGEPAGPRVPGCRVAPDEDGLLDDYAADPAITLVPDGVSRSGPIQRQHGCIRLDMEDTSITSVETFFTLSRDYDRAALRAAYDPVAQGHGWAVDTIREAADAQNPGGGIFLMYCRPVRGVISQLVISTSPSRRTDIRASGPDRPPSPQWQVEPGSITVVVEAVPERPNCQAAVNQ